MKNKLLFLLIFTLLLNIIKVTSLSCDTVAALPKDFTQLLPQSEKLKRIHLSNFFFLDDYQGSESTDTKEASINRIKISLNEKSAFKIQVTPQHVGIEMKVKINNSKEIILETIAGIPLDYTSYSPIEKGIVELSFSQVRSEDEEIANELKHGTSKDEVCDTPYMQLEIYIEEYQHLKERLHHIRKETENLDEFDLNFEQLLKNVMDSTNPHGETFNSDTKIKHFKTNLDGYKLTLPHSNGLKHFERYNISVIKEFEFNVPDEEFLQGEGNSTQAHIVNKFFLKMQMYSDFFLGGSFYFLLVRSADIDSLQDYECLTNGRCFLSNRPSKNGLILESILTPGSYKILLVNLSVNSNDDSNSIRKILKLDSIPVTAHMKIKFYQKAENRFNCEGRHLPHSFDYLMNANKENYFEYKGEIVMDLNNLYDQVDINVEEDSILRLISFYSQGNNIDIELYEVNKNEMNKLISQKGTNAGNNFISSVLNRILPKIQSEKIVNLSKHYGESDGLIYTLRKGVNYKLVFNYQNSFFNEMERKTCEMFHLKLVIAKESYLKTIIPSSCPNSLQTSDLDNLVRNLEQNHQSNDEYTMTTPNSIKIEYKPGDDNIVLYSQKFEIKESTNLHFEVISEFVSSYIVPIVIPLKDNMNIKDVLHHKYDKLISHENSIKLKLNKGKYMLALINGLSQDNKPDSAHPIFNNLHKCMSFKLRLNSIRLSNRKMMNWECNYIHFDEIPDNLNNYINEREKFVYFNKHLLLPGLNKSKPYKNIKFMTGNKGYFLRLIAEYKDKNSASSNKKFEVTLNKNGKVIKKAKEYIIDYDITSDQVYLNYYLKQNSEYEIRIANFEDESKGWNYFEYCRLFKLEINLIREDFLQNRKQSSQCIENTPKLEQVVYERLIDVENSFSKYGTKTPIQMFTSVAAKLGETANSSQDDLEVIHPKGSQFVFKYIPENQTTGKEYKNSFSYNFEVKSYLAKATFIIENSSVVGISAKLRAIDSEGASELIAAEDLEGQGLFSMRGVLLQAGKYTVTFYVNTHTDKTFSDLLSNQCVTFSATVLIENKPFDFALKNFGETYENCPYLHFPSNLNIPGWIHADTDYTINEFLTFKLEGENKVKRFTLHERSIFKFHFPNDDNNNLLSYISLFKVTANKKQKLVEKLERQSNYLNTVLEKGTYQLDFVFTGVGDTPAVERKKACNFYNIYLAVIPISNVIGGIDSFNPINKNYCEEKGVNSNSELKPNTYIEHAQMKLINVQYKPSDSEEEISEQNSQFKKIKLVPANHKGKFVAELIFNHYIDVLYKFIVYKVNKDKELTEIPTELVKYENFVWVTFHFEKHTEYQLEIRTANFDNYSVCSDVNFSYNYEEYTSDTKNETEDEYMNKKDTCAVEDHLPSNLFTNTNNILNKYGGAQSETTGEINFYGEFLLPKSTPELRLEFLIRQKSALFVKIVPKYSNVQTNNIFLQLYRDKKIIYRLSHSEQNGVILMELDTVSNYINNEVSSEVATPYFLEINFDRTLSNCETFDFIFVVVPRNVYINEYLSCDEERDKLPDTLSFDKTSQFSYTTSVSQKDNSFTKDDSGNFFKLIKLEFTKATTLTIVLEYITSDNMMDILLYHDPAYSNESFDNNYIELGNENFHINQSLNGISSKKEISMNLKKGHFILQILYHRTFSDLLKKSYSKELDQLCFGFILEIEGVVLKNLKKDSQDEQEDNEQDPQMNHLSKNDFTGNYQNVITSVDPPEMKNMKLETSLDIEIKFAYSLEINKDSTEAESKYLKMIYLQDVHNLNSNKMYPQSITNISDNKITFNYEVSKSNSFDLMKCYKLFIDASFKNNFDPDAIDVLNHIYCTVNCDCLSTSHYKCSQKGKCICHPPYTGNKCEQCIEGYKMNNKGKCVDVKLSTADCDEKLTCSGHGQCVMNKFDAFSATATHRDGPCRCKEGFTSYNSPQGYPSTTFCNSCTNPIRTFPFCSEKNGADSIDTLDFTFDTNCREAEGAISLPSRLYDNSDPSDKETFTNSVLEAFGGGQDADGSLDMLAIFKVKEAEENTEIFIPEDSIIRVFYESHEINRAKIMIIQGKYETNAIAYTEGKEKSESFIARLEAKNSPYYLKMMHNNLKYGCNRYRLKIVIKPLRLVLSDLICRSHINFNNKESLLPPSNLVFDSTSQIFGSETTFIIPDYLILNQNNQNSSEKKSNLKSYTNMGVLSNAGLDEEFIYNIKIEIKSPVTFAANALFDFLTSDLNLILRDNTGKILRAGDWLIPDATYHASDNDFINGLQTILDPGTYYLTLIQNVPANHLMQIIIENEQINKIKHVNRCFRFSLHIQTSVINKPDQNLSTVKFESMYNRIVDVEPESISNVNVAKKFEIFVTFEDSISSSLNPTAKTTSFIPNQPISFRDAFYLENTRTREKLPPTHVYLQGSLAKTFLIVYDENVMRREECYKLKYNLDLLLSSNDKDRKITSDAPLVHKFCTKNCNCNPQTNFECDASGKCECEEPYTGEGCYSCIEGWYFARGKCISESNCGKNFCSGHGKCKNNSNSSAVNRIPTCQCDNYFTGADCSQCSNENDTFPDCIKLEEVINESSSSSSSQFDKFLSADKNEVTELDVEKNICAHPFVPHNLDSLGYLHLDGNMHLSGKYSIKHINNKHYSMVFTVKERSHVKIFLEHSKSTHIISMFLLDNNKKLMHSGSIHIGPSGIGSLSFMDFVIDPIKENNSFAHYEINFFIKDIPADDSEIVVSYQENAELSNLTAECFTVFLEMQVMTSNKEINVITSNNKEDQCVRKQEKLPQLVPAFNSILDYHTVFYNSIDLTMKKYTHIRDPMKVHDLTYFHYEYFYVPDHLDQELILEIEVYSKFLNSQVGVLLEIVEIPVTDVKVDHKKLNAKMVADLIEKNYNGKKLEYPECNIHCFSGVKKFNSVLLSRILPSDTFFRIWFYDLSPMPKNLINGFNNNDIDKLFSSCVNFEVLLNIKNVKSSDKSLQKKKDSALCISSELPSNLNTKGFLGDQRYLEKWGFHILDTFRIDQAISTGLVHETVFEIKEYHVFRMVVFHGRVDTDLELYFKNNNNEEILISRSNSKNFEDAIVIEIPPGKYKILFKFFPPAGGFHKCESIKMEFSMNSFQLIQENIDRMVARHKNNPSFDKIDFYDQFTNNSGKNILDKDAVSNRYTVKVQEPFKINIDDAKSYEPSVALAELTFVIEPEDSGKVELISFVNSDFLYLDANVYLSSLPNNSKDTKDAKIIAGTHRKNMNILFSGPLESGTYVVTVRYYRRLHYKIPNDSSFRDVNLFRATFGEIEFDAMLANKSNEEVSILTSLGYMKIPPFISNKNSISHNWLCRHSGLPLPKSLSSMRYLEFNNHVHILDNFLVPAMGLGEEVIKFRLRFSPNTMIRVYVECHSVDIDLELREKTSHGEYKVIASSKDNIHFETIMQIISDDKDYEIVLKFKGKGEENENSSSVSLSDPSQSCLTFKMEIALEKSHNYACPESSKYSELTSLKPIPEILPVKGNKIYKYDSRKGFKGDENDSGYVYMLRTESDKVVKYTQFTVESDIDIKIEIENDFMQAPINILLTSTNGDNSNNVNRIEANKLATNVLGLTDAYVVAFGEIFENRTILLAKNLPKGFYTVYLYLPGLKTRFLNEPRVCSIYDIVVEVKKSRYHFKEKEIIDTAEIVEDNLDLPTEVPSTLNSLKFLEGEENYINYLNQFYLRSNKTVTEGQNVDLYNTISFTVKEESIVEFYVSHNQLKELLQVAINGYSHFGEFTNALLKPGNYLATIKVENSKSNKQGNDDVFDITSLTHLIQMYVGISPISRVNEIYSYNNIQSTYHQCKSMKLPQTLDYDESTHTYNYHQEFFTFNKEDLRNLKLGQFTVVLKSNNNRIMAELGADYVLNKMSLVVKSEHKTWKSSWSENVGDLDIIVPSGTYSFELEVEEKIIISNLECLIFSLDIHIVDNDFLNTLDDNSHPLYNSHLFDSSHSKSKLLTPKCEGSVLPLELHKNADTEYHKIKENGDYLLHLGKASYFLNKQHSQNGENLNDVDINLHLKSLVRIVTSVERPNEFQVIPKVKYYSKNDKTGMNYYLNSDIQFISHNLKERHTVWFLDNNKDPADEFYTLELIQEKYEELTETSASYHCPYYTLDILIQSVKEVASRMECIQQEGKETLEYILPNKEIPSFKGGKNSKPHHEKIFFSYFTEKQYGDNYIQSDQFTGMQYVINFTIEEQSEYHLSLELGYNQVISLFDVYLSKYEDNDTFQNRVIATSLAYFDKYDEHFPYKRVLNANLSKGKYVLLLVENIWNDINRSVKVHSNAEGAKLCLPFSYSLDIIPANDKTSMPEVISVFPPGPLAFKSLDEDLNIKVVLSKPAFNKKHEPITYLNNFMNIINAFYLAKSPTKGKSTKDNFNDDQSMNKIHPIKLEGSENNKEWNLLFMKEFFEANFDYELKLDNSWLYDVNYSQFKVNIKMPVVRVETTKEAIFDFVDNIKGMKGKMNEAEFKPEKNEAVEGKDIINNENKPNSSVNDHNKSGSASPSAPTNKSTTKCGEHGKLIYDNILRKHVCTCLDGFSGKFCQVCDGVYDKTSNKCIVREEDEDEDSSEPTSESVDRHNNRNNEDSHSTSNNNNKPSFVPPKTEHKSCDGGCVNGYCDSKVGRCVCDINYTGPRCDKLKPKANSNTTPSTAEESSGLLHILFKLIIGLFLFALLYYFYTFIRKQYENKGVVDYQSVPSNEFEMSVESKSINNTERNNDLELIAGDNHNLVDYEIKAENTKYRKGKKKDNSGEKRNEL